MSDSDFPTTILTSKTPTEVANFLPHSLQLSSKLIENNLSVWFANYASMISRYNQDLNALVANGRTFFSGAGSEFGSLDKIWNCVASSVMSQIQVNESLVKVIKKDVLGQFQAAFKDDFKYSELLVNSEELLEMQNHLDDANGAYNWNVKAPAILGNFENYKRFEKDLIFSAFISYLNTLNTKTAGLVHKNENAVNFILKEYQIDNEMQLYTEYMIKTEAPPAESKKTVGSAAKPSPQRPQPKSRPSAASANSGSTAGTSPVKEKRKSKLRSKMGSILGRKKKSSTPNHAETIREDESAVSVPSRQGTFVSRADTRNSVHLGQTAPGSRGATNTRNEPAYAVSEHEPRFSEPKPATPPVPAHKNKEVSPVPVGTQQEEFHPAFNAAPLQPFQAPKEPETSEPLQPSGSFEPSGPFQPSQPFVDVETAQSSQTEESQTLPETSAEARRDEEANFVKYSSSEDESDVPVDKTGKRLSLLNAHDLGQPPKVDNESDSRSRNTSSGKYSFEYGDEAKSISTPQHTPIVETAPQFEPVAENEKAEDFKAPVNSEVPQKVSELPLAGSLEQDRGVASAFNSVRPAPPPPPSRKAHSAVNDMHRDGFHNLQNARESFIQPHSTGNDRMSLISQTTGNSLLRQDHFKHFGASEGITRDGLNTSIAEIINATFKDGKATKTQILGEIAFNYNSSEPLDSLTINIPTRFSKFLLNDQLMTKHGSEQYTLNLAHIAGKTLGGIKYSLDSDTVNVPVIVKQIWKFEPRQASLIIKISLNSASNDAIRLENFSVAASLDNSVASLSASSKPEGSFNKDLNRITWRYTEPLDLTPASPEIKLIARIMTTGLAKEAPSGVKLRFNVSEGAVPNVKILDASRQPVPSIASLTSGNYSSYV